jgi:integrase
MPQEMPQKQKRTFEFNEQSIKALAIPPKPKQMDFFDTTVRGFGLRVSYGGRRCFFLMYSNGQGKRQRVTLGEFGQLEHGKLSLAAARKRAKAKMGEVAKDHDPAAEAREQRKAATVQALAEDFIAMQRKRGKKSVDRQEKMLARDVLPQIGATKARDLTRRDIKGLLDAITDRGAPILANRVHEVVRRMFNFGLEEEEYGLESNPADRLGKHRNPEHGRERWLTLEEIGRYWKAVANEDAGPAAALKLLHLTAQRQANVLGMRVSQLSLSDHLWTVPASATKTGKTYKVPLSGAAVEVIKTRIAELEQAERRRAKREGREPEGIDYLFPKRGGKGPANRTFLAKPHASACKRAKIAGYTLHDSRHTFGTHCDQLGIPRLIWDGILGHTHNGMADLYSGHDFAEKRHQCMVAWANRIAAAGSENVIAMSRKRGGLTN